MSIGSRKKRRNGMNIGIDDIYTSDYDSSDIGDCGDSCDSGDCGCDCGGGD
jgi:hypothetical protein